MHAEAMLSPKDLEMFYQLPKRRHHQELTIRRRGHDFFVLQNPSVVMRNEHCIKSGAQSRIDVRLGAVAHHPCALPIESVLHDYRVVSSLILFGNDLDR